MRPPAVEEGILFAWWVYSTLKFWGLLRVEYGLDLFPLSNSEGAEREEDAHSLQGLFGFLLNLSL